MTGIACLVGAGDTRTGLVVMIGVAVINLPLAWGFGFGLGPLPALGFVGIALGTALCHVFGSILVIAVLIRGRSARGSASSSVSSGSSVWSINSATLPAARTASRSGGKPSATSPGPRLARPR